MFGSNCSARGADKNLSAFFERVGGDGPDVHAWSPPDHPPEFHRRACGSMWCSGGERVRTQICPLFGDRVPALRPDSLVVISSARSVAGRGDRESTAGVGGERVRTETCPLFGLRRARHDSGPCARCGADRLRLLHSHPPRSSSTTAWRIEPRERDGSSRCTVWCLRTTTPATTRPRCTRW